MAAVGYIKSISWDFPNQKVATCRLEQEIRESAIVTALDRIDTAEGNCSIRFKAALSSEEETIRVIWLRCIPVRRCCQVPPCHPRIYLSLRISPAEGRVW